MNHKTYTEECSFEIYTSEKCPLEKCSLEDAPTEISQKRCSFMLDKTLAPYFYCHDYL